ncbi:MAG: endo-1,4-beta-xylanase [Ruminococcus sp.]|nr:endo-1,4-beta-xylanase [Ruminococcus sp.]
MKYRLLALLSAAAIMLAGCGSSDSSSSADANKPSDGTGTSAVTEASEAVTEAAPAEDSSYTRSKSFVETKDYPSLKELYKDRFLIGCAISTKVMNSPEYTQLAVEQFNSYTAENEMKPERVLDQQTAMSDPGKYNEHVPVTYDSIRTCLEYAQAHGFAVRGHTLVWHSQTPEWFFYKNFDKNQGNVDRETMLKRMENYIKDVLEWTNENYPGLIYAWDVVNEAASDSKGMRKESKWYEVVGEDFVEKAFEYARKYAAKDVKLFYNDYNAYQARKQKDIISFLKPIAEAGNLDGVGMQSHIGLYLHPNSFMSAVREYVEELGDIEIQITELDIGKDKSDNWEEKQKELYKGFFEGLMELQDDGIKITSVTIWGLTDDMSWRKGENALMFNRDLSRKPAFDGVVEAITGSGDSEEEAA